MIGGLLFWGGLAVAGYIGFVYFRDLGDVSQMLLNVKRENMVRFIRNEYRFLAMGLAAAGVMVLGHFLFGGGPGWVFWSVVPVLLVLYGFPWVWVHLGLRNQINSAQFFPIEEARKFMAPHTSVVVIEKHGKARAHSAHELMRPHLAGDDQGLDGENVVMTYCTMANLGQGYTPEVEGEKLDLAVLAQHGNNLILRDNTTGEPIQQIYGYRESDGPDRGMRPWPTIRMSFRGFQKAFPDGEVFLNKPSSNPLLRLLDMATELAFSTGIDRQNRLEAPVMDNMTRSDDRLPNKTWIWGLNVGEDAVAYTDDFVMEQDGPVNATVGGRSIVLAWHQRYESLGAWYNDSGAPIEEIDFFGHSDRGRLERVETLKAGVFWHVWAEFFPQTDINRVDTPQEVAA